MELRLANAEQFRIADLLWAADTMDEVNAVLDQYGQNARVVYELMTAATFDEVKETDLAQEVLAQFRGL